MNNPIFPVSIFKTRKVWLALQTVEYLLKLCNLIP